jgi:cbb3-type cytochrome oxidase maturation protein
MSILYILIPLGLVLVAFGVWAFFWAVGSGQFDDLETPGWSVLVDEHSGREDGKETEGEESEP